MALVEDYEIQVLNKAIHCAGCETRIQSVLARVPGVEQVKAEQKTQKVHLTLNPERVSVDQVREKLQDGAVTCVRTSEKIRMSNQRAVALYILPISLAVLVLVVGGLGYLGYLGFLAFVTDVLAPRGVRLLRPCYHSGGGGNSLLFLSP